MFRVTLQKYPQSYPNSAKPAYARLQVSCPTTLTINEAVRGEQSPFSSFSKFEEQLTFVTTVDVCLRKWKKLQ